MAVEVGVNSYETVENGDLYFANRLDAAAWTDADIPMKGQAMTTATMLLDELHYGGTVVSESQLLAHPRVGSYFDPRLGYTVYMDGSATPVRMKHATFELAYHLLNNDGLLDSTGSVTDLELGPISLKQVKSAEVIPALVKRIIKPLLVNNGSSTWWRAN